LPPLVRPNSFRVRKVGLPPLVRPNSFRVGKEGLPPPSLLSIDQQVHLSTPNMRISWYLPAVARKWSNRNLPGALHFLTGNTARRLPVFEQAACCYAFIDVLSNLREEWPFKLIAYVLMPDHIHLIVNPKGGRIRELAGALKSLAARRIIDEACGFSFLKETPDPDGSIHQVWQESFKALPLWSNWLIWQKINYIHNNPVKSGLVRSAADYRWSSFRSFYSDEVEPIKVDKEWWWPDDVQDLGRAAAEWSAEIARERKK
jgi:putative transposase